MRRYYEAGYAQLHKDDQQIVLLHNKEYMARYLKLLLEQEEYEKFIHSATAVSFPFMTSVLKCDIGMVYMQLGRMEEAEETLESAYWMVPSKILPKYLLFILYRDTNQYSEARRMAEEIISQKIFQVGSVYLEARSEAKHFLKI